MHLWNLMDTWQLAQLISELAWEHLFMWTYLDLKQNRKSRIMSKQPVNFYIVFKAFYECFCFFYQIWPLILEEHMENLKALMELQFMMFLISKRSHLTVVLFSFFQFWGNDWDLIVLNKFRLWLMVLRLYWLRYD